jgi:hypothetical protein
MLVLEEEEEEEKYKNPEMTGYGERSVVGRHNLPNPLVCQVTKKKKRKKRS